MSITRMELCPDRGLVYRVKAWRTVDQDGHRRPQYYGPKEEPQARMTQEDLDIYMEEVFGDPAEAARLRRLKVARIIGERPKGGSRTSRYGYPTIEEELRLSDGYWQPEVEEPAPRYVTVRQGNGDLRRERLPGRGGLQIITLDPAPQWAWWKPKSA